MSISEDRPRLVVGIDFGTTFSGIAWGLAHSLGDVDLNDKWPGGGNASSQKVPTISCYKDGKLTWGYEVDQLNVPGGQTQLIQGVKLLLDESQSFRYEPTIHSKKIITELGKTPVDVAGDFLGELVAYAQLMVQRRYGSAMRTMDLEYILTVPAVWSDKAKHNTLMAAHQGGIPVGKVKLLSEPEAAAVYAIQTIQPNVIEEGDCFIVCDAGGGTVDIITYRVTQLNPLRITEAVAGTGAVCGSVMLDERFDALLKDMIEKKPNNPLSHGTLKTARRYWRDYIKPNYTGPLDESDLCEPGYWVPVPGVTGIANVELSDGHLYIEKSQVQQVFDPIVEQIESLVAAQREKVKEAGHDTKAIILVGGLGASECLFRRLQATSNGIQIMQPPNAWSAVVRGAVIRGQEGNQVDGRIARRSYGICHSKTYDATKHINDEDKRWCRFEEVWKVDNFMEWYIQNGQSVTEKEPIKMDFYRVVDIRHSLVFEETLSICPSAIPPRKRDSTVQSLCSLEADLSKVPKTLFTQKVNSKGTKYYHINYSLVLLPTSASLLFELEFNGVSYGAVKSSY